jgi:hypothetical protein
MVSGSSGLFMFNEYMVGPFTSSGKATITWDGDNSPGVLSYLLDDSLLKENANTFKIDVGATGGMDLLMTVYTDATHASATAPILVPNGFSGPLYIPYSAFTQPVAGASAPADFSDVGAITLSLDGTAHAGSSIILNSVETVPEPSTLALAVFGAMALLVVARRSRRR